MRYPHLAPILLISATLITSGLSADETLSLSAEGWHTWQLDETGASTQMCCFSWKKSAAVQQVCDLDGRHVGFSNDGDCASVPGSVQVYVRLEQGEPEAIRVLSSNCRVSAATEIKNHGTVSADVNVDWFRHIVENKRLDKDIREEALFGLVQTGSDTAYDYIDSLLTVR